MVSIKDSGTGLDPEIIPQLFKKFATKSEQGTGLGLFISKNIIEAHDGIMWGENNSESNGAIFYFTLPIWQSNKTFEDGEWEYKITNNKKILLVDNEVDITYALTNALENEEFNVESFNDPIGYLASGTPLSAGSMWSL